MYKKILIVVANHEKKHLNFGRVDNKPFEACMNKIIETKKNCWYHNLTDKYQLERTNVSD